MIEFRWLVTTDFVIDPFVDKGTQRVLQFREGEYLQEDEEGWTNIPEVIVNEELDMPKV